MTQAALPVRSSHRRRWLGLAGFGLAVFVAAAIGGLGVSGTSAEYGGLEQPAWAPPSWLFGPVWTVLYVLIAISGWLVWQRVGFTRPIWLWSAQLVLNAIWTPLFFGAGQYGLAFADIVLLWLLIGATVAVFWRVHRPSAVLLLPYWAWVTFAGALNLSIWLMNT